MAARPPLAPPPVSPALVHLDRFLSAQAPGLAEDRTLAEQARALSRLYTEEAVGARHATASLAYLAYFGPRAVSAVTHALRALPKTPRHAIDIGAGSGASALALLFAGVQRVTLVEPDGPALDLAKKLLAPFSDRCRFVPHALAQLMPHDADLLSAAFVFGELPGTEREAFALLERAAPKADAFLLIDAGDRLHARRLQTLRDALVLEKRPIAGPCGHTDPCPALVRERDWCHDRIDKGLPKPLATFAALVGRDERQMSLSWLAVAERARPDAVVVIGEAKKDKGRVRLPVCGPQGLRFVQALKRDRGAHDALLALQRGARLPLSLANGTDCAHVSDSVALARL